jgi:hypothetical protein
MIADDQTATQKKVIDPGFGGQMHQFVQRLVIDLIGVNQYCKTLFAA